MKISEIIFTSDETEFGSVISAEIKAYSRIFILTDSNVAEYCLPTLISTVPQLADAEVLEVEPGEESKSIEVSNHLWSHLAELNADRNTLLINLGGGMVTDLGGWIASTYKRGIPFIHIPTTLLAMADASIGGKTGIDHNGFKNIIGTFAQPKSTILFTKFLESLPEIEKISGFAEILKTGLIADQSIWNMAKDADPEATDELGELIQKTAQKKKEIVTEDFYETGLRKTLNFGHTIGHAIESYFLDQSEPLAHGIAVGLGMICETSISIHSNTLDRQKGMEIIEHLSLIYDSTQYNLPPFGDLKKYILQDKKNADNQIMFVLLKSAGEACYNQKVDIKMIEENYAASLINISG